MVPILFDTTAIRDDPAGWDALASRVATHAAAQRSSLRWLGQPAARWTAFALVAAACFLVVLARPTAPAGDFRAAWAVALAPRDNAGRAVSQLSQPPAIGALLLAGPAQGGGR